MDEVYKNKIDRHLLLCLTALTAESAVTVALFFLTNVDGGHWLMIFAFNEIVNLIYFSLSKLILSSRNIKLLTLKKHTATLVLSTFLFQNFNFIWMSIFNKSNSYLNLVIVNFLGGDVSYFITYILFLIGLVLLSKKNKL